MKHFNNIPIVTILLFSYILSLYSIKTHASALTSEHEIYKGFINPPQEAKPRVWWHWMDGNITEEGIYKDLLWMNRIDRKSTRLNSSHPSSSRMPSSA